MLLGAAACLIMLAADSRHSVLCMPSGACSSCSLHSPQATVIVTEEGALIVVSRPAPAAPPLPTFQPPLLLTWEPRLRLTWEPRLLLTWEPPLEAPDAPGPDPVEADPAPVGAEGGDAAPDPAPQHAAAPAAAEAHAPAGADGEPAFEWAWAQTGALAGGVALAAGVACAFLPFTPARQARARVRGACIHPAIAPGLPCAPSLQRFPLDRLRQGPTLSAMLSSRACAPLTAPVLARQVCGAVRDGAILSGMAAHAALGALGGGPCALACWAARTVAPARLL